MGSPAHSSTGHWGGLEKLIMTTLDTEAGTKGQPTRIESAPAPAVAQTADTSALITEQQVMFGSAAALAPAKTRRWSNPAYGIAAAVHAMFSRPEKPRTPRHYPSRHRYLENAAMSRAMDRL
jgi:hypothetical protein